MNLTKLIKVGAGLVALSAIVFATPSQAAQPAISFSSADTFQYAGIGAVVLGYRFTVGTTGITLSQLGVYDRGGDGLLASHDVVIWDAAFNTVVASGTVGSGVSGTLNSDFRYVNIGSTLLNANSSYIIGAIYNTNDLDDIGFTNYAGLSVDSSITLNEMRFGVASDGVPLGTTTVFPFYAGPNFIIASGAGGPGGGGVPEPGTVALLIVSGFTSIGVVARNRRIRK